MKAFHKHTLSLLFSLFQISIYAQYDNGYVPLDAGLEIPAAYASLSATEVEARLKGKEVLTDKELEALVNEIFYYRKQIFESGHVYLNNEVAQYVEKVAGNILAVLPDNKDNIEVYLAKSSIVNAYCIPDGSLYINIGLVSAMENESQLAFILAHEIAHYIKEHAIHDMKRLAEVAEKEKAVGTKNSNAFRQLQFSRESEFDADGYAVQLVLQSGYDGKEASKALEKLRALPFDSDTGLTVFDTYFNTEYCSYDTAWVSEHGLKETQRQLTKTRGDQSITEDFGDLNSTHPDLEKRVYAVREIVENSPQPETYAEVDGTGFQKIREICRFEMLENSMKNSHYVQAVYFATNLLKDHPENPYLLTSLIKSLFWISHYKEIHGGKLTIREPAIINDTAYLRIYSLLSNLETTAAKKLAYGTSKSVSAKLKEQEELLFYMALNTEHFLGDNAAFAYYNKYLNTYPQGKYRGFVKNRLAQ